MMAQKCELIKEARRLCVSRPMSSTSNRLDLRSRQLAIGKSRTTSLTQTWLACHLASPQARKCRKQRVAPRASSPICLRRSLHAAQPNFDNSLVARDLLERSIVFVCLVSGPISAHLLLLLRPLCVSQTLCDGANTPASHASIGDETSLQ